MRVGIKIHKILILTTIILYGGAVSGQLRYFFYYKDSLKCYYTIEKMKMTGLYKSYYKNGVKRSEGNLINGYRKGKWTLWDSTGKKRMERIYSSPFDYLRITPPAPQDTAAALLLPNAYTMSYNNSGIIEYASVKSENSVWRHKYWRLAGSAYNEILFRHNFLLATIIAQVKNAGVPVYDTVDDRFSIIDTTVLNSINENVFLTGLILKEECFFDVERMCFECRILGLCPIVKYGNKTRKFGWLYYPDLRIGFGQIKVKGILQNAMLHSLDDFFIFRNYSASIIKTTVDNPYDKFLIDYPGMTIEHLKTEQFNQEINIIESEHNLWLYYTK